jgi:hypothetical protein
LSEGGSLFFAHPFRRDDEMYPKNFDMTVLDSLLSLTSMDVLPRFLLLGTGANASLQPADKSKLALRRMGCEMSSTEEEEESTDPAPPAVEADPVDPTDDPESYDDASEQHDDDMDRTDDPEEEFLLNGLRRAPPPPPSPASGATPRSESSSIAEWSEFPIRSTRLPRLAAETVETNRPLTPADATRTTFPLFPDDSAPPAAPTSARRVDRQNRSRPERTDETPWSRMCSATASAPKMDANSARRTGGDARRFCRGGGGGYFFAGLSRGGWSRITPWSASPPSW